MPRDPTAAARRSRLLRLAVVSSTLSKLTAFAFQVISLPLVFHTLDPHSYALFLLVSAVLATLGLTQLGIGSGLTQELAKVSAIGDAKREASLFGSALILSTAIVVVAGMALFALIHVPPERLLGSNYGDDQALIIATANVCIPLMCAHIVLAMVDSALAGYQEQFHSSIGTCVSNVFATVLVVYVCRRSPTLTRIILATFAPLTATRLVNLVALFARRPHLLAGFRNYTRETFAQLTGAGLAFWFIQLSSVVEQNVGILILGHYASTEDLGIYGFVYKAIVLGISAAQIITLPLWPAFVDARIRRELGWITRLFRITRRTLMIFAAALALGLLLLGEPIFTRVLHKNLGPNTHSLIVIFAIYCVTNIWDHLYYVSITGLGSVWRVSIVIMAENAMMVVLGLVLVPHLGVSGMALSYLAATLLFPIWRLPMIMSDTFRILRAEGTG